MAVVNKKLRFKHVMCAEVRVRMIGPSPATMAKLVLVDDLGNQLTSSILHQWGEKSKEKLRELLGSLEEDLLLALAEHAPSSEEDAYVPDGNEGMQLGFEE